MSSSLSNLMLYIPFFHSNVITSPPHRLSLPVYNPANLVVSAVVVPWCCLQGLSFLRGDEVRCLRPVSHNVIPSTLRWWSVRPEWRSPLILPSYQGEGCCWVTNDCHYNPAWRYFLCAVMLSFVACSAGDKVASSHEDGVFLA